MLSAPLILSILGVGVAIVIGGILWAKLPAFLALILAAIAVAALTPTEAVRQTLIDQNELRLHATDADSRSVAVLLGPKQSLDAGDLVVWLDSQSGEEAARLVHHSHALQGEVPDAEAGVRLEWLDEGLKLTDSELRAGTFVPLDALKAADKTSSATVGSRIASGFGSTCAKIGILIAMAAIIGKCLLDSGAADRIVRTGLKWLGETGAPAAFVVSGFLLGIPVFFDTVFYLMIPLGKAMRMRTGRNYLLYVLTIVAGGTMAHSLVPPTPGPLLVADQLGVDVGLMILVGCAIGSVTGLYGLLHASIVSRIWELPLRESPDLSTAELEEITSRPDSDLPPLWLSLLPILLPVLLIGGETVTKNMGGISPEARFWIKTFGDKNLALVVSAAIAVGMLIKYKISDRAALGTALQGALASGGMIILITAAGGAFGAALQQTGVALLIEELPTKSPLAILALAFFITTAIRTAQGSATVAMITAVGVLAGFSDPELLGFHPVYLACAIGCGSKPIAWMNDSGFWVITRLSGMTEAEGLKYVTPMTAVMGLVGLGATMLGAVLVPLI